MEALGGSSQIDEGELLGEEEGSGFEDLDYQERMLWYHANIEN